MSISENIHTIRLQFNCSTSLSLKLKIQASPFSSSGKNIQVDSWLVAQIEWWVEKRLTAAMNSEITWLCHFLAISWFQGNYHDHSSNSWTPLAGIPDQSPWDFEDLTWMIWLFPLFRSTVILICISGWQDVEKSEPKPVYYWGPLTW